MRSALITIMMKAAEKAARVIAKDFREIEKLQTSSQKPHQFAAFTLENTEKELVYHLSQARKDFGIMGHHTQQYKQNAPCFIINALDGFDNFCNGYPHFCMTIAVKDGAATTAALIYNPLNGTFFYAEKNMGAVYDNGNFQQKMRVASLHELSGALLALHMPVIEKENDDSANTTLQHLLAQKVNLRMSGSLGLDYAYHADGRLDAVYACNTVLWQQLAGLLVATEAGAASSKINVALSDIAPKIICAPQSLHSAII